MKLKRFTAVMEQLAIALFVKSIAIKGHAGPETSSGVMMEFHARQQPHVIIHPAKDDCACLDFQSGRCGSNKP